MSRRRWGDIYCDVDTSVSVGASIGRLALEAEAELEQDMAAADAAASRDGNYDKSKDIDAAWMGDNEDDDGDDVNGGRYWWAKTKARAANGSGFCGKPQMPMPAGETERTGPELELQLTAHSG